MNKLIVKELKIAAVGITLGVVSSVLSGCGLKIGPVQFPNGFDIHAGINAVDNVDSRRGVKPGGFYGQREAASNGLPNSY